MARSRGRGRVQVAQGATKQAKEQIKKINFPKENITQRLKLSKLQYPSVLSSIVTLFNGIWPLPH